MLEALFLTISVIATNSLSMASTNIQFLQVNHKGISKGCLAENIQITNSFSEEAANNMIEHMNDDHVQAIIDYCKFGGVTLNKETDRPIMTGIGTEGFIVEVDNKIIKFYFEKVCETPLEVRHALIALAKAARA